jgi:tetratricopeptide (TPR) repeat protein
VWTEWDWEKGEREFLKVLEMNPNDAYCRAYYAHLLMILGRTDEAYEQGKLSLELDVLNPLIQALFCVVLLDRGEYEEVLSIAKRIPNHPLALFAMEITYYKKGDYKNSFETLIQTLQFTLEKEIIFNIQKKYEEAGYKAALEGAVNAIEEKEAQKSFFLVTDLAGYYRDILNKHEKTLDWLEVGFKTKDPNMPYLSTKIYPFDFIRDNPRYIELLKKMNLPIH